MKRDHGPDAPAPMDTRVKSTRPSAGVDARQPRTLWFDPKRNRMFLTTVAIACTAYAQSAAGFVTFSFGKAGWIAPGVIGATPIDYAWKHHGHCYSEPTDWKTGDSTPDTLQSNNFWGPIKSPYHNSGFSESQWGFNAVNAGNGYVSLRDGLSDGTGKKNWAMSADAKAPSHWYGSTGYAVTATGLFVGKSFFAVPASHMFTLSWSWTQSLMNLRSVRTAEEDPDDYGKFEQVYSAGADGFAPIDFFKVSILSRVDEAGSTFELDGDWLRMSGSVSSLASSIFAINHELWSGQALLDHGSFVTSGIFSGLPWELTMDPLDSTRVIAARLAVSNLPSYSLDLPISDIGGEAFWNSNPWFTADHRLEDYNFIPVPASTLVFLTAALGGIRKRRQR